MMDLNVWHIFLHASLIVKGVMLLLITASIASWTVIVQRALVLKKERKLALEFEDRFWSGANINQLYQEFSQRMHGGLQAIFIAGYKEFQRLQGAQQDVEALMESAERAMRIAKSREIDHLQTHLSFLATVSSNSPFIGLFGTVWGIMTALHALGGAQQASIAMVAPGIAETLIATAMGLFAAIPASIAYNRYVNDSEFLANQYDTFQEELTSILHRRCHSKGRSA